MVFQPYDISGTEQKWQKAWSEAGASGDSRQLEADCASRLVLHWAPAAGGLTWTDLRSLVLADVYSRFQRSKGRDARIGRVLDGFHEDSLDQAIEQEKLPGDLVSDRLLDLEFFEKVLAIQPLSGTHLEDGIAAGNGSTSDPGYYRFTQWLFLELLHSRHISAAAAEMVEPKESGQEEGAGPGSFRWRLEIAPFAEKLFADVDKAKWPASLRKEQKALIGRKRGTDLEIAFIKPFHNEVRHVPIFTTQLEAMHGVTFVLVAPGHDLIEFVTDRDYSEDVEAYLARFEKGQESAISGVRTGGFALNPVNLEKVPVLVSPLALGKYSDGVVLGIPAHDKKQFELAKRLKLRVREVIHSRTAKFDMEGFLTEAYEGDGKLTNSGPCSGMKPSRARDQMIKMLSRRGICNKVTRYSLKDLPVSGESAWGAPVPLFHALGSDDEGSEEGAGVIPADDGELPLNCPEMDLETLKKGKPTLASCKTAQGEDYAEEVLHRAGRLVHRDAGTLLPWLGRAWSFLRLVLPNLEGAVDGFREDFEKPYTADETDGATGDSAAPPGGAPVVARQETAAMEDGGPGQVSPAKGGEEGEGDSENAPADGEEVESAAAGETPLADAKDPIEVEVLETESDEGSLPDEAGEDGATADGKEKDEGGAGERDDAEADEAASKENPAGKDTPRRRLYPFSGGKINEFLPVDVVFSGTRLSPKEIVGIRCITKFLYKHHHIPFFEPFRRFCSVGHIHYDRGEEPQAVGGRFPGDSSSDLLGRFGSDALRLQMLCLGPVDSRATFDADSLYHIRRFLEKIWREIGSRIGKGRFVSRKVLVAKHRLVYDVSRRLKDLKFHTAVSAIREFLNFIADPDTTLEEVDRDALETFLVVLKPFAPHLAAELWCRLDNAEALEDAGWPEYSTELVEPVEREHAVFVDGRMIDRMTESIELEAKKLESRALGLDSVRDYIGSRKVSRVEVVPGRLIWICLHKKKPVKPRAPRKDHRDGGPAGDPQSSAESGQDSPAPAPDPRGSSEKPDPA